MYRSGAISTRSEVVGGMHMSVCISMLNMAMGGRSAIGWPVCENQSAI